LGRYNNLNVKNSYSLLLKEKRQNYYSLTRSLDLKRFFQDYHKTENTIIEYVINEEHHPCDMKVNEIILKPRFKYFHIDSYIC
jgi:hypothetical protein